MTKKHKSSWLAKVPFIGSRLSRFRKKPRVAVLHLSGVIGEAGVMRRGGLNLADLEDNIEQAFDIPRLKAVAICINSPGGSPVQSALIAGRIRELAKAKKVRVYAFCDDVAASGGYWLACAADEIYANAASIVGSIGVITASFGFPALMKRLGVERRVYTAGENKRRLDPFLPENKKDVTHLKSLQEDLHAQFKSYVQERRGKRLRGPDKVLFSGDFWSGTKGLELGLVDGLGDVRSVMRKKFGNDVRFYPIEEKKGFLAKRLGMSVKSKYWADDLVGAIEERAFWNRYGL
ncbi:MAG: S49 family peptidase [Rhodospirillaceae bacterium]|nr:S49 family peptidase [Rhodospirillaceae bacterium]